MLYVPQLTPLQMQLRESHIQRLARLQPNSRPLVRHSLPAVIDNISPLTLYLNALQRMASRKVYHDEDVPIPRPMLRMILGVVARIYKVKTIDIKSKRRNVEFTLPRQVFCYLAREKTEQSYPYIGRFLGGRDHTTVLHAVRKIERLQKSDLALAEKIKWLSGAIDIEFEAICEANGIVIPYE